MAINILIKGLNKMEQINLDIKSFSKKLGNFTKAYANKSIDLKIISKKIKHNEYLEYSSKIYGFQSYKNASKKDIKNISLETIKNKLPIFLDGIGLNEEFNKEQFINTFLCFISNDINKLKKENTTIKRKITIYLNSKEYEENYNYLCGEIARSYKVYKKENLKNILFDYQSIAGGVYDLTKLDNDVVSLMYKQVDIRNSILIKNHISDKDNFKIEDMSIFDKYSKEIKKMSYSYETAMFLAKQYEYYHMGWDDSKWHYLINGYDDYLLKEKNGEWNIKKITFESVIEDMPQYKQDKGIYKTEEDYSYLKITLLNDKYFYFVMYNIICYFEVYNEDGRYSIVNDVYDNLKIVKPFWKKSNKKMFKSSFHYQ